jgi:hypothetical protein
MNDPHQINRRGSAHREAEHATSVCGTCRQAYCPTCGVVCACEAPSGAQSLEQLKADWEAGRALVREAQVRAFSLVGTHLHEIAVRELGLAEQLRDAAFAALRVELAGRRRVVG